MGFWNHVAQPLPLFFLVLLIFWTTFPLCRVLSLWRTTMMNVGIQNNNFYFIFQCMCIIWYFWKPTWVYTISYFSRYLHRRRTVCYPFAGRCHRPRTELSSNSSCQAQLGLPENTSTQTWRRGACDCIFLFKKLHILWLKSSCLFHPYVIDLFEDLQANTLWQFASRIEDLCSELRHFKEMV